MFFRCSTRSVQCPFRSGPLSGLRPNFVSLSAGTCCHHFPVTKQIPRGGGANRAARHSIHSFLHTECFSFTALPRGLCRSHLPDQASRADETFRGGQGLPGCTQGWMVRAASISVEEARMQHNPCHMAGKSFSESTSQPRSVSDCSWTLNNCHYESTGYGMKCLKKLCV